MSSGFVHVVACVKTSFLFRLKTSHRMSISEGFGVVNSATVSMSVPAPVRALTSDAPRYTPRSGIAGSHGNSHFPFDGHLYYGHLGQDYSNCVPWYGASHELPPVLRPR